MSKPLYIGLRGLAGSGKDTVGNFLSYCLDNFDVDFDTLYEQYNGIPKKQMLEELKNVYTIALADPLKKICSDIFGIPIEPFYSGRKNTSWVNLDDFTYTETKPYDETLIITAEEYYQGVRKKNSYMSIRDIMVYVGTYMLQKEINRTIFVNLTENQIKRKIISTHHNLSYVIVTDIRFQHELDYIHKNSGIMINITRNGVMKMENIAENSLDDYEEYDYEIQNNSTYENLFRYVYDLVHSESVFKNEIVEVEPRTFDSDVYLRKYIDDDERVLYRLCTKNKLQRMSRELGQISMIDPEGGPSIQIGEEIPGTNIIPTQIVMDDNMVFWIYE